jgi:hypothetical protein
MCSVMVYVLHCICVCGCDGDHESLIMLSHSVMVRRPHLLVRCYLGTICMCTTAVRCSAIEGIYIGATVVGPYLCWRIRVIIEEVAYKWHLGYLGAIGLFKPTRGRLTPCLGTSSLLSLHVDVWRFIFLKLSLSRNGMRGCSAPWHFVLYVLSFFKNGTDLTVFVI